MSKTEKKQENGALNENLEPFHFSKKKLEKVRKFCIVSYLTEKQIKRVMRSHVSSIRAFCYIHHNVDESEPHWHILLRTYATWSASQIGKWFHGFTDEKGERVNTLVEPCTDMDAQKLYIFHQDEESIKQGKHMYYWEDLYDYGYRDLTERKNSVDNTYEILNAKLLGVSQRDLVRKYGRDYLYHIHQYQECVDRIIEDEGYTESRRKTVQIVSTVDECEKVKRRGAGNEDVL